jgi:hypothetical protein
MNKNELKKILKPLIKECIKEVLFEEEGALSHVIKEVAAGLGTKQQIVEAKAHITHKNTNNSSSLRKRKKDLLDAIGKDAYNGVNLFEGTTPTTAPATHGQAQGPLSGVSPSDPGVDISNLFSEKALIMSQRLMENK